MSQIGLIGTITSDHITYDSGRTYNGLGGILYQAAVLCGLGEDVSLYTNCGLELKADVEKITLDWKTLRTAGLNYVPGPGNQVYLRYSERSREREEILISVVPLLNPDRIHADLPKLDALLMVFNSGLDLALEGWRRIIDTASCPIWLDIHSLVLEKKLHERREYVSLPEWRDWVGGVDYLQANRQEVASLLGHPERWPERDEIDAFVQESCKADVRVVFITMGKEGVLVATSKESRIVSAPEAEQVVDVTGCGDVFCARTLQFLTRSIPVFEAASAGVEMASRAVGLAGIIETYRLARQTKK